MDLNSLNVFSTADQVAWVGSGGKSSLIFALARQLFDEVIITTTTHLSVHQTHLADRHIISANLEKTLEQKDFREPGITLISQGKDPLESTKIKGYFPGVLTVLSAHCRKLNLPLFIEADGARQKGIKAPAEHEPQIPDFVTKVCVVMGLGVIGKPISKDWVHRPERFAQVVGKNLGDEISFNDFYLLSKSETGSLKNVPKQAHRILFLNQADLISQSDDIYQLALSCKENFDQVIISSVDIVSQQVNILAHFGQVGGALLAAGESKRFNSPKQLAAWHGTSFVRTIAQKMEISALKPNMVITGAYSAAVNKELQKIHIIILHNDQWSKGQSESVKKAVQNLPEFCEAIVFLLVDQPQIDPKLIDVLLIRFALTKSDIIAYQYQNQIRHPVLFSRKVFPYLLDISGEAGGRQIFTKFPPMMIEMKDPQQALDFDTAQELEEYNWKIRRNGSNE